MQKKFACSWHKGIVQVGPDGSESPGSGIFESWRTHSICKRCAARQKEALEHWRKNNLKH